MALKVGPVNGHTVMLDAQSDPNCIWIMCSCGAILNVSEEPSGDSLKESIIRISEHLDFPLDEESVQEKVEIFDQMFPREEQEG